MLPPSMSDELSSVLARLPTQDDRQMQELGRYVRRYAGPPAAADESGRSSLRQDAVIQAVNELLTDHPGQTVRVLDACCGNGLLAKHLAAGLTTRAGRVGYWALDQDRSCVGRARKQVDVKRAFAEFDVRLGEVWLPPDEWRGRVDLAVLSNTLHELPPSRYPDLFAAFNRLLTPGRGRVWVVDMESLPADDPEAVAVNWSRAEVEQFLKAGGLDTSGTTHSKSVGVLQVQIGPAPDGPNAAPMLREIDRLLRVKLDAAVRRRQEVDDDFHQDPVEVMRWVVLTGTIARLAEEILEVEARLKLVGLPPAPSAT